MKIKRKFIYDAISRNFKDLSLMDVLKIADIMLNTMMAGEENAVSPDDEMLQIICYLAINQPNLSSQAAIAQAEAIRLDIQGYIDARNNNHFILWDLNIEQIRLYLWVIKQHPQLSLPVAVKWLYDINRSTVYSRVVETFDSSYPFCGIQFSSFTDGRLSLEVWSKTYLGLPNLECLKTVAHARTHHNCIEFSFNLNK